MNWRQIQKRLAELGYGPGPIDGIPGPLTRGALKRFQGFQKIPQTGRMDALTWHRLFVELDAPEEADLPWMATAEALTGTREIPGARSNATIMEWADLLDLNTIYTNDDIAWCGLFVGHCIRDGLPHEALPSNILGARQWLKFGEPVEFAARGAVAVFWRGSPSGWQGHVGFVVGADKTHLAILGGNQGNEVNVRKITRERLLGFRWPVTTTAAPERLIGTVSAPSTDGDER